MANHRRRARASCSHGRGASLFVAGAFRLPEAYWAAITTIVVMQSSLGAAVKISAQRFAGTALGAAAGALLAMYFPANAIVFGAGVFLLGLICIVLSLDRAPTDLRESRSPLFFW